MLRVRVCGGLEVEADGRSLPDALVGGRQGRLVFAYLTCQRPRAVRREELAELLWGDRLPDTWTASLSAVISRLRRLLTEAGLDGAEAIVSAAGSYQLVLPPDAVVDLDELEAAVAAAEDAAATQDAGRATEAAALAAAIAARGFLQDDCDWVDRQREVIRDLRIRAGLALSAAHLGAGASARAVEAARDALALDETREASYRQLMRALAAAGERGEALRVWERCRIALVEDLGIDPSPETEAVYLEVLGATPATEAVTTALPSGVVTFLLTDIVDSSSLWDKAPDSMALALERHDTIIADTVAGHGGTLLKSKLEGDATVSVFARASDGATAALALSDAMAEEPWPEGAVPRVRMAMHTGEAFERGGDYFGPALNRAARLRSLAGAGEVLLSQAVTELVRDHLPAGAVLRDLGHRDLRGLSRGENVYSLRRTGGAPPADTATRDAGSDELVVPPLAPALSSTAPFVGRGDELTALLELWEGATTGAPGAAFIGGEPGVGKSRLAGEIAARAHDAGAIVLYGRCDEDLAAPLQPFIEALHTLVPALGPTRVASIRGVDELARVVPELAEQLPDRAPAVRADPDTERLALFDAVANVIGAASAEAAVLLVLDDLHWAGKTTLSLLRHVLRGAKGTRLLVVGTYRDTELARTHPLAETLADLRRDADATRISLSGLAAEDIAAYLDAVGIDDRALGRELAEVTSGNPFFVIEVLRHVEETGGTWSPGNLPEGVREATGRRLSRLSDATNQALTVAAVVGASFELALLEQVEGTDLVDQIAEACQAGLVSEEQGSVGRFRFAHALVRQVLLAELVTVKRARLHKAIAELLETAPVGDDPDARLADLAYHWSECASLGDAAKAVDACRRAADSAAERLAYEEAGDLYGMALQVLDERDDPDGETRAGLHLARCDALLTAGDVAGARDAIDALEGAAHGSERLAAWYTTYEGLLAVLAEPDRLTEIVQSIGAAAGAMRAIGDLRGEARAHYVHASALERLGQIGAAERALDAALAAARSADDRRLADSILAEAPPAALWGPSTVTRASGRCLDVVRVLRINDGAPAVESVALRCQAVLEALRGRDEAARRMIASSRRTVERLGLAHRQLETEVMAGFIELLAGDASAAEELLRGAYEGLRDRGLGGEAAQAAAFLGRALLLQDRVDEADEVAAEAEALAGADLKAAIAWRGVRAEAAARRGDPARALALAEEAVELAGATDALLLVADARLALATVLHATGDHAGAAAEAGRAIEACDAKGATALAARARGGAAAGEDTPAGGRPPASTSGLAIPGNEALAAAIRFQEAFNRGDMEAIAERRGPGFRFADRRLVLAAEESAEAVSNSTNLDIAYASGARFDPPELLVARGRALALVRLEMRSETAEWSFLVIMRVDEGGDQLDFIMFDAEQRRAANQELDELTPDDLDVDSLAWRTARRFAATSNAKDLDGVLAQFAPEYERVDRRSGMVGYGAADQRDIHRTLFTLDDWAREVNLIELHGDRRALVQDLVWFRAGAVADAEVASLVVHEVDEAGLIVRQTGFNPDDLEAARAELHADTGELRETTAWRSLQRFAEAVNAHDWDAWMACIVPDYEFFDRKRGVTVPDGTDPVWNYRQLFALDDWSIALTPLEAKGDRRILVHYHTWFRDGIAAEAEVESLCVFDVDANGLVVRQVSFEADDLEAARAELRTGSDPVRETTAWRGVQRFADAINAHDWETWTTCVAPGYELLDRRGIVTAPDGTDPRLVYELLFSLDDYAIERTPVEAHGDLRILVHDIVWFRDGAVAEGEIEALNLFDVDEGGRVVRAVSFAGDDLEAARAELHSGADEATASALAAFENEAWRVALRMRDALVGQEWSHSADWLDPAFEYHDNRTGVQVHHVGMPNALESMGWTSIDDSTWDRTLVATRGERLALIEERVRFVTRDAGPAEIAAVSVLESTEDGKALRSTAFDPDDLDAAYDELDRRYVDQGGPDMRTPIQAQMQQDWDTFREVFAPTAIITDHRWAGLDRMDRDGFIAYNQQGPLVFGADVRPSADHVRVGGTRAMLVVGKDAGSHGGGAFEVTMVVVHQLDRAGRIDRSDLYDLEHLAEAWAHYERLVAGAAGTTVEPNLAWRVSEQFVDAYNTGDRQALVALHSPVYAYHDRRSSVTVVDFYGAEAFRQFDMALAMDEFHLERTLIAARGEQLVLVAERAEFRDGATGPAEIDCLTIFEVDRGGLALRNISFDPSAMDEAMAELEARHQATEPAPAGNAAWATMERFAAAFNAKDLDRMRELLNPRFTYHDRRATLQADLEGEDALSYFRAGVGLDEFRITDRLVAARGEHLVLLEQHAVFRDGETGLAEITALTVVEVDDDGRMLVHVGFDAYALEEATAELDARYKASQTTTNLAWQAVCRDDDAADRRDWEAFVATKHPDYEYVERRRGLLLPSDASWQDVHRTMFELDDFVLRHHLITTRGDHLALTAAVCTFTDGATGPAEVNTVVVTEVAADGLIRRATVFDPDQLDEAAAELDARYELLAAVEDPVAIPRNLAARSVAQPEWVLLGALGEHLCLHDTGDRLVLQEVDAAGEEIAFLTFDRTDRRGAATAHLDRYNDRYGVPAGAGALSTAINAHDLAAVRAAMTDDCVIEDHRQLRVLDLQGPDGYVQLVSSAIDLAADYCVEAIRVHELEPWGHVTLTHGLGTTADGAPFELLVLSCVCWDDAGGITRIALYEPEEVEQARARLASHRAEAVAAEDPLHIPRNLAARTVAKDGWTLLAAVGDHLSLHDTGERLAVHEVDAHGEVIAFLSYDHADRGLASDEISRRFFAHHPQIPAPVSHASAAVNAHDLSAVQTWMADGCEFEDHRHLRVTFMADSDDYLALAAAAREAAPDFRWDMIRLDAMEPWGIVCLIRESGTSIEGAQFEGFMITCSIWAASGHLALLAIYDPEDREEALARLAAAEPSP